MKTYLLDPFGEPAFMNNVIFESPYGVFREILRQKKIDLQTYDKGNIAKADKILCFNYHKSFLNLCQSAGVPKEKMVLFIFEPSVIIPEQYHPAVWDNYGTIFTVRDDLVQKYGFHKFVWPQGGSYINRKLLGFEERKYLILINGNHYSYEPNELYTLRRRAIRFFEKKPDFDLYGRDWNKKIIVISPRNIRGALKNRAPLALMLNILDTLRGYSSYRGSVDNKYDTLEQYKYCLCFENEREAPGYFTEKIFDCFFTGTVPIYYGASNVEEYIPKDCFIDLRHFDNFAMLDDYLRHIDQVTFAKLQKAGQRYIHSKKFTETWLAEAAFTKIAAQLD